MTNFYYIITNYSKIALLLKHIHGSISLATKEGIHTIHDIDLDYKRHLQFMQEPRTEEHPELSGHRYKSINISLITVIQK